ncbi:MAG TPA: thioesterase family protein [Candidatus Paceibacterota bacterium]
MDSFVPFSARIYSFTVFRKDLDELGHCSFNKVKLLIEQAFHRFAKDNKFGRTSLRLNDKLGLFVTEDAYRYKRELGLHDIVTVVIRSSPKGRCSIRFFFNLVRVVSGSLATLDHVGSAEWTMVMMGLESRKPVAIPTAIAERLKEHNRIQDLLNRTYAARGPTAM